MSRDPLQKMFNLFAPVFHVLDLFSVARHNRENAISILGRKMDLSGKKVLDIGCGTGIWSNLFRLHGATVTGIDFAPKMIGIAKKKYPGIGFAVADAGAIADYPDDSFDIATLSFVLHDIVDRSGLLREMRRISQKLVIFDYGGDIPFIPAVFEFFEGNRYKDFLNRIERELEGTYGSYERIGLAKGGALYIAEK